MATINHLHSIRCVFPVFLPTAGSEHESWRPTRPGYLSTLRPSRAMDQISFPVVCFLNTCFHSATLTHSHSHTYTIQRLTSGSAITISIFFSANTANSANRLLMTNSPGLSSGSMVMLDMAATLCFSHKWGDTEGGARRLLTLLLLTGADAAERTGW